MSDRATGTDAAAHAAHLQWMGQFLGALPLAHVPEPASLTVMACAAALLTRRRARL